MSPPPRPPPPSNPSLVKVLLVEHQSVQTCRCVFVSSQCGTSWCCSCVSVGVNLAGSRDKSGGGGPRRDQAERRCSYQPPVPQQRHKRSICITRAAACLQQLNKVQLSSDPQAAGRSVKKLTEEDWRILQSAQPRSRLGSTF